VDRATRVAIGIWTLAIVCAALAVVIVATSDHTLDKVALLLLAVPTELAFVASGILVRLRRPQNRTGLLLIAVGFGWFLGALNASDNRYVFTAGLLTGTLFTALLAHLLLAFPTGHVTARIDRFIVRAFYAIVIVLPPIAYAFDDGKLSDSVCDGPCPENVLSVEPTQTVATATAIAYAICTVVLAALVLVRLVLRWHRASPALRRALTPVLVTAGVLIALALIQTFIGFVSEDAAKAINWVVLAAVLAVPLAFLYGLLRSRFAATTRRLVAELSQKRTPAEVQDVLRRALHDPTLELGYPAETGYAGVNGEPLRVPDSDGSRAATEIGEGIIVHDASLKDQPELDEVADAAHIALERGLSLISLEASTRRTTALLDAVPDNVFRVRADGLFIDAQVKRNIEVFGDARAFVGRTFDEVLPAWLAQELHEAVGRVVATGELERVEYALKHDGRDLYLEARIVRSAEDEVVAITRDLTELRQSEITARALAEEQAALTRVAVAVATADHPDAVFDVVTEEVGRLLGADAANLLRFDAGPESALVVGKWSETGIVVRETGERAELGGGPITRVYQTRRAARGHTEDPELEPHIRDRLRSVGITNMVASPIEVSGTLWGAVLVMTVGERAFGTDAEVRIGQFAQLVGVALASAQAREQLAGLAEEQAALGRVAVAVATEHRPEQLFDVVTEEVGSLFGAQWASIVRYEEDDTVLVVGNWHAGEQFELELGARFPLGGGAITRVKETRQPARIDYTLDPDPVSRQMVAAPIVVSGRLWGATTISVSGQEFPPDAAVRLGKFTSLVAVALANAEAREQLTASRARIVQAGDAERRRLERNLHDGAQQRLVSVALGLRMADAQLERNVEAARALLTRASEELAVGLEELRELARGIHPAILTDRGLAPALEALAERASVPVVVNGLPQERLPEPIEAAAFYVVSESLANVAKYASAESARVDVVHNNGTLVVQVTDDGVGGADVSKGSGLRGLADRVEALGGRLDVSSERGRGTTVRAELPVS
jgi:signal transduction histidine kinase